MGMFTGKKGWNICGGLFAAVCYLLLMTQLLLGKCVIFGGCIVLHMQEDTTDFTHTAKDSKIKI